MDTSLLGIAGALADPGTSAQFSKLALKGSEIAAAALADSGTTSLRLSQLASRFIGSDTSSLGIAGALARFAQVHLDEVPAWDRAESAFSPRELVSRQAVPSPATAEIIELISEQEQAADRKAFALLMTFLVMLKLVEVHLTRPELDWWLSLLGVSPFIVYPLAGRAFDWWNRDV